MKKLVLAFACSGLLMAGCGEKLDEMQKGMEAAQQLAEKSGDMEKSMNEAQEVYKARAAKGDTVAMPYKDLQAYLPSSISGYKVEGEPAGSQQSMGGFSMSQAQQKWVSESNPDASINVSIMDYGGTEGAYSLASLGFAMSFSSEDDQQRTESLKSDVPTTSGVVKFDKVNKGSSLVMGTRYRYLITVESAGAQEDQTKMLTDVGTEIAKKFEGK